MRNEAEAVAKHEKSFPGVTVTADRTSSEAPTPSQDPPWDSGAIRGMPKSYYFRHSPDEVAVHADVIGRRKGALVIVEPCPGAPPSERGQPSSDDQPQWMCVVTDDRPGLLSLLSAAISAHSLDILSARVYTRTRAGHPDEAVDLFAVRGLKEQKGLTLGPSDFASIQSTMVALLEGEIDVATLERRSAQTSRPTGAPGVVVTFDDSRDSDLLVVEAGDRPGLLLAISLTIFRERLTIVRSHVTTFAATARDEFELAELDGSRLTDERKVGIADKVRDALLQETRERSSEPPKPARR